MEFNALVDKPVSGGRELGVASMMGLRGRRKNLDSEAAGRELCVFGLMFLEQMCSFAELRGLLLTAEFPFRGSGMEGTQWRVHGYPGVPDPPLGVGYFDWGK